MYYFLLAEGATARYSVMIAPVVHPDPMSMSDEDRLYLSLVTVMVPFVEHLIAFGEDYVTWSVYTASPALPLIV